MKGIMQVAFLRHKVLISTTLNEHLFHAKVFIASFLSLLSVKKEIGNKAAHIMQLEQ